jgi:hypothetical protein
VGGLDAVLVLLFEAPESTSGGVRGRLAEAVLLKHFALFEPCGISVLTVS